MSKPIQDRQQWESEYESGLWDRLQGVDEFAHYAVLAAFIQRGRKDVRLLDLGSGEGVILRYLNREIVNAYTALDISQTALDRISPKLENDRVVCSTLEEFKPDGEWDVILFNEILYYTSDPVEHVVRLSKALAKDGLIIISMYQKRNPMAWNNRCIRKVRSFFQTGALKLTDSFGVTMTFPKSATWQIFVAKKPTP